MAFEPPIAVYDACVLYPFHLRNLLVQCAVDRLVDARWTDEIHDEWIRNLTANDPTIPPNHLYAARDLMNVAVPTATVKAYEAFIPSIVLPDADDRHVVAAAVAAGASVIVTWNVRDFPAAELRKHRLRKLTPDIFLTRLYDQIPDAMIAAVARARRNLRQSKVSAEDFVAALRRQKLVRFTSKIESRQAKL
jgi:predicted nucleic acid-binding protein